MKVYKEGGYRIAGGKFGTIINVETAYPRGNSPRDLEAADKYDLFYNRIFLDPAILGHYEEGFFDLLKKHDILMEYTQEELEIIQNNTLDCCLLYTSPSPRDRQKSRMPSSAWKKKKKKKKENTKNTNSKTN